VRTLITVGGACTEPSAADLVAQLVNAERSGFWLDIENPDDSDMALLDEHFHFHPLTLSDVRVRNQRPKLDSFEGYAFVVLFGAEASDTGLAFREHHLYFLPRALISVHQEPSPILADLIRSCRERPELPRKSPAFMKYLVVNAIVESLFPVLERVDETIDTLSDAIVARPAPGALAQLNQLKHDVTDLRRILGPQRDVFQRLLTHSLDDDDKDVSPYWRDVYQHLVRQYEEVDSLRDLMTGTMDVYLSTVSNRLGATMKQLTVIASLFLPLTFLTGFFGMNFGLLVRSIAGDVAFWLGVGLMALVTAVQLYVFRRSSWI
jgi:magnesium transporter